MPPPGVARLAMSARVEGVISIMALDATDDPIDGNQEERFFHGYYGHYCYLPLYIFAGEHLLCGRLRRSNVDAADGAVDEMKRIVGQIRQRWPKVWIVLRADSGFCRDALLAWCESTRVDYVIGLAKNARLKEKIVAQMNRAEAAFQATGKPARVSVLHPEVYLLIFVRSVAISDGRCRPLRR